MIDAIAFDPWLNEAIRSVLPGPVVTVIEAATHLGDPVTVLVVATAFFWTAATDREYARGGLVLAIVLVAFALTNGLKGAVLLERPVEHVAFAPDGYGGYSFPSGHAMGAAAIYGGLAVVSDWGTRRRRYALAGALVATVALSRLVLGVHYLGDVVAGVTLGLAVVWALVRFGASRPGVAFALAGAIAAASAATPSRAFMPATLGVALGATVTWLALRWIRRPDGNDSRRDSAVVTEGRSRLRDRRPRRTLAVGGATVLLLFVGTRLLSRGWWLEPHWTVELGAYAVATCVALLLPLASRTGVRSGE